MFSFFIILWLSNANLKLNKYAETKIDKYNIISQNKTDLKINNVYFIKSEYILKCHSRVITL